MEDSSVLVVDWRFVSAVSAVFFVSLGALARVIVFFIKRELGGHEKRIHRLGNDFQSNLSEVRLRAAEDRKKFEAQIADLNKKHDALSKETRRLIKGIVESHVHRDDWLRTFTAIDAKMDNFTRIIMERQK